MLKVTFHHGYFILWLILKVDSGFKSWISQSSWFFLFIETILFKQYLNKAAVSLVWQQPKPGHKRAMSCELQQILVFQPRCLFIYIMGPATWLDEWKWVMYSSRNAKHGFVMCATVLWNSGSHTAGDATGQVIPIRTWITTATAQWNIRWYIIGWRCSGKVYMRVCGFVGTIFELFAKLQATTKQCGLLLHTNIFFSNDFCQLFHSCPLWLKGKWNFPINQSTTEWGQTRTLTMAKSVYLMCMCGGLSTSCLWLR